jgi:membrane carboxypeptidase/penicillin-binding protein PbpC
MQNTTQRIARYRLAELAEHKEGQPPRNVRNAAIVALNPATGQVLTMLGSPDYFDPRIDGAVNATTATRQPGSSIKPLTYAAAFDPQIAAAYGYAPLTPASMMVDVRTSFVTKEGRPYAPENYDRVWRGPVLMRPSLAGSYNLIAVKVLEYVGLEAMIGLARSMGITTFDNKEFGLALTLGGGEVRLLELTSAYAAFANGGRKIEPVTITRITDHAGNIIYESPRNLNPGPQVLDPRAAYLITDILSDDYARRSTFGAGSPLSLSRPAAAKTGTTQDWRDNWTIGYTPDLVVGVWVGNADNEPMRHISGVTGAAPIWRDVMEEILKARPAKLFAVPEGLVEKTVCADNGLIPVQSSEFRVQGSGFRVQSPGNPQSLSSNSKLKTHNSQLTTHNSKLPIPCPHTINEIFIEGTQPQRLDDWHYAIAIDRRNGLLAGPGCPLDFVTFTTYTFYPAEAQAWARKQGISQPPSLYSPLCPDHSQLVDEQMANYQSPITNDKGQMTNDEIAIPPVPPLSPSSALVFTSPDQGSVFRIASNIPLDKQKIRVSVRPVDGVKLQKVMLLINGQLLAESSEVLWQMSPGVYTFEVIAIDAAGNNLSAQPVTIEVVGE